MKTDNQMVEAVLNRLDGKILCKKCKGAIRVPHNIPDEMCLDCLIETIRAMPGVKYE